MVKQCSDMCQKRYGLRNTLKQCSKSGQPGVSQGSPGVQPGVQPGVSQGAVRGRQGSPAGQPGGQPGVICIFSYNPQEAYFYCKIKSLLPGRLGFDLYFNSIWFNIFYYLFYALFHIYTITQYTIQYIHTRIMFKLVFN